MQTIIPWQVRTLTQVSHQLCILGGGKPEILGEGVGTISRCRHSLRVYDLKQSKTWTLVQPGGRAIFSPFSMASFLIKDVRIFDGENTVDSGSVLVEGGKIFKVSSSPIEFSGTTISKPGHTLLPGLIDVHVHCDKANVVALPQALRFGVTTVCDMHNEWPNIQKLRKQRDGGDCADIKTTSFAATIDMGWPMPIVLAHHKDEEVSDEFSIISAST